MRKAGICKTPNEKSRDLQNSEWKNPESLKPEKKSRNLLISTAKQGQNIA
jgi:hypothetical protein